MALSLNIGKSTNLGNYRENNEDAIEVKAASDLYSPVSGEVVAVNEDAVGEPQKINDSPYQDGWLIRVKLESPAELENLLSAAEYEINDREHYLAGEAVQQRLLPRCGLDELRSADYRQHQNHQPQHRQQQQPPGGGAECLGGDRLQLHGMDVVHQFGDEEVFRLHEVHRPDPILQ